MSRTVILDGARTPFGKVGGMLKDYSTSNLDGFGIKGPSKKRILHRTK